MTRPTVLKNSPNANPMQKSENPLALSRPKGFRSLLMTKISAVDWNFDETLLFHFGLESKAVRHITKLLFIINQ